MEAVVKDDIIRRDTNSDFNDQVHTLKRGLKNKILTEKNVNKLVSKLHFFFPTSNIFLGKLTYEYISGIFR